jgi:hypothetical protein
MADTFEVPFKQLSSNISAMLVTSMKEALGQMHGLITQAQTKVLDDAIKSSGGQAGAIAQASSSQSSTASAQASHANVIDEATRRQNIERATGRRTMEIQAEMDDLSGRNSQTSSTGAYARSRKMAREAGVNVPELTSDEKERFQADKKLAQEEIGTGLEKHKEITEKLSSVIKQIGSYTEELREINAMPEGAAKTVMQEGLAREQAKALAERDVLNNRQEAVSAGINRAKVAVASISSEIPTPPPEPPWLTRMIPGLTASAALMGVIGGAPLAFAQSAAARAEGQNLTGRQFMRGDTAGMMSTAEIGGSDALRDSSITNTILKSIPGILGAVGVGAAGGFGVGAMGGPIGALGGAAIGAVGGLYHAVTGFQGNVTAEEKARIDAQNGLNAEQREAEGRLTGAAGSAFGKARGYGITQASSLIMGREGGGRMAAAAMGVSGEEYEDVASRVAKYMGVTSGGQVRAGQNEVNSATRMASLGLGGANDLTEAMFSGGQRGSMQAQGNTQNIISDALKAGIDQSVLPDLLSSIASNTQGAGFGAGGQGSIIGARDIQAAQSVGATQGPEAMAAGRAAESLEKGGQSAGSALGFGRVMNIEADMKKMNPKFKGFTPYERIGIANGNINVQSLMASKGAEGLEFPGLEEDVKSKQMGGAGYKQVMEQAGLTPEQQEMFVSKTIEGQQGKAADFYQTRQNVKAAIGGPTAAGYGPQPEPGGLPTTGAAGAGGIGALTAATLGRDATLVSTGFNGIAKILPNLLTGLQALDKQLNKAPNKTNVEVNLFSGGGSDTSSYGGGAIGGT